MGWDCLHDGHRPLPFWPGLGLMWCGYFLFLFLFFIISLPLKLFLNLICIYF